MEDINQDYTLNEYEKYYQYRVRISPDMMNVGQNFIVDKRENTTTTRDGNHLTTKWYLFRIPVEQYEKREGNISDFSSIRFMRMFMTGFENQLCSVLPPSTSFTENGALMSSRFMPTMCPM